MHRIRRYATAILIVLLAALTALGCTPDAGKSKTADKPKATVAPKLGMDHKVVCTVYDDELTSAFIRDRIDDTIDYGESQDPEVDYTDLEIEDYDDDDLPALEANHLDYHIERLLLVHEADEAGIEITDEDVADRIEDAAEQRGDENADDDEMLDDFYDEQDDEYSLDEQAVERLYRNILVDEELADAVEDDGLDDDYDDYDDFTEAARDRAEDHVDCGKDFEWDPDFDYSFAGEDSPQEGGLGDESARDPTPTVDPAIVAGRQYVNKVGPRLLKFERVVRRFAKVSSKLVAGKISITSTIGGFKRQQREVHAAVTVTKSVRTSDAYLRGNHSHLVSAQRAFEQTLVHLVKLEDQTSEAGVDREVKIAERYLDIADKELIKWQKALQNDPKGRDFSDLIESVIGTEKQVRAAL